MGMRLPKKVNPETKLTNDIAATLRGLGWLVFRFNSGGLPTPRGFVRVDVAHPPDPVGEVALRGAQPTGRSLHFEEQRRQAARLQAQEVRHARRAEAVVRGADDLLAVLRQLDSERGG
jgi:hypothetical protein